MAVRMELARILIKELSDYQLIELREVAATPTIDEETGKPVYSQVEGGRSFPIVIGLPEAQAIERRLKGVVIKRPQTHDLLANVITALGGKLESITINDLADHTFFAQLNLRLADGKPLNVDCRPSDAIALGIANNVPIFVAEHVLDSAQNDQP
jgi:bifunctional DNase/RNase